MTADTFHVLASIDAALDDCAVSEDAMRWNPDAGRVICDGSGLLWPERWSTLRHGAYHYTVTAIRDSTEVVLEDGQGIRLHDGYFITPAPLWFNIDDFGAIGDGVHDDTAAIQAAINAAASQGGGYVLGHGCYAIGKRSAVTCWDCGGNWRRARCTTCHPLAFPGPILGRKPSARRVRRKRCSR